MAASCCGTSLTSSPMSETRTVRVSGPQAGLGAKATSASVRRSMTVRRP
jgi:hypothetical protein